MYRSSKEPVTTVLGATTEEMLGIGQLSGTQHGHQEIHELNDNVYRMKGLNSHVNWPLSYMIRHAMIIRQRDTDCAERRKGLILAATCDGIRAKSLYPW